MWPLPKGWDYGQKILQQRMGKRKRKKECNLLGGDTANTKTKPLDKVL